MKGNDAAKSKEITQSAAAVIRPIFPRRLMKKAGIILPSLLWIVACADLICSQSIFEAAKKGDLTALKAILQVNPGTAGGRGEVGRSPLHEAILAGQREAEKTARCSLPTAATCFSRETVTSIGLTLP
jgi:hypothetical protein